MKAFTRIAAVLALALPLVSPAAVRADPEPPVSAHASANAQFSDGELDRLLAPVALYPDSVLTHVLAASTYPLEVVEAARWTREHPKLQGEDAVDAVDDMDWDPSVKALVAFPELLARMDSDLQWTQDLGDAFLSQEGAVMDRVQYLRDKADASGHLNQVEHVRVVREREYIYIEPEVAEVLYVPYYDPLIVYGSWWWPAYPPHRWGWWAGHPVGYYSYYGPFYWGIGFNVAPRFYSCAFDWPRREVVVVNHYDVHNYYGHSPERYQGSSRWQHEPEHRHGVAYREPAQNAQWHRGYSRPESRTETSRGNRDRNGPAQGGASEPRREWTVNRARDNREHEQTLSRSPRDDTPAPREQRRQDRSEGRVERRDNGADAQPQPAEQRTDRAERRADRQERNPRLQPAEPRSEPRPESRSESRSEPRESRSERAEQPRQAAPERQGDDRPRQGRRTRQER